ncbi:sulfoxide reductase heme-binding subunit YedZ [Sphingobium sp. BYY-5]|uniref:sulfite oxidase heme-binding subunit YedZ n=1 Tax=Sphingobium sp. BYY-5 TaxID=2926400 RepID=UPI001FA7E36B|nr:protein-methionine-sulfoxide reductase heme-binding subunit MsrQ [Sphingobium sp. BYY-5]MCI4590220.1 sulfoxide reductase heme-binding subunit YedZ [Sphingobium sp. BYY-5]
MARTSGALSRQVESGLIWLLCVMPLLILVGQGFADALTANPVEYVLRELGLWALRFLCLTLALSPLARFSGWRRALLYRRRIGLWAFAYACLHLSTYIFVDQALDWPTIVKDIVKRPYITIGMAAFLLLVPLAITSINRIRRRMAPRSWLRLHRAIYPIAIMGVAHFYLLVKADHRDPLFYGIIVLMLLGIRLVPRHRAAIK